MGGALSTSGAPNPKTVTEALNMSAAVTRGHSHLLGTSTEPLTFRVRGSEHHGACCNPVLEVPDRIRTRLHAAPAGRRAQPVPLPDRTG